MDAYTGEIRLFCGTYAPDGWAYCNGTLLSIAMYPALHALIGNRYGGDGRTTFAVPNFQGMVAIGLGQGPGTSAYQLGQTGGEQTVPLSGGQMGPHTHTLNGVAANGNSTVPANNVLAQYSSGGRSPTIANDYASGSPTTTMAPSMLSVGGGSMTPQPHNNMQPFQAINYIICLNGAEFPVPPN
ncbi:phage tail protein [Massilia sp. TS11]|uniref:phage tail protein n=1 Tax=Massilia sp. TS11 TaxID=2908003 RepID=UPI001EDB436E|nr:tail fiber protein [Massilia sp. TS11]MCG2585071.1 tail fiber protein [Massilia sp. TS11]